MSLSSARGGVIGRLACVALALYAMSVLSNFAGRAYAGSVQVGQTPIEHWSIYDPLPRMNDMEFELSCGINKVERDAFKLDPSKFALTSHQNPFVPEELEFDESLAWITELALLQSRDGIGCPISATDVAARRGAFGVTISRTAVIPLPPPVYLGLTGFAFVVSMKFVRKLFF